MKFFASLPVLLSFFLSSTAAKEDAGNNLRQQQKERDLQSIPPPCPSEDKFNEVLFDLTRAQTQIFYNAMQLTLLVTRSKSGSISKVEKKQEDNPYYSNFTGFGDINDQALVAKVASEDTCYGVFMGSEKLNPFDAIQNLNPFNTDMENTDCQVRSAFFDAYSTSYNDEFRNAVNDCVASCGDTQCPLVFAGYGSGGAVAVVAAIDLNKYTPSVVTFGSPRPIVLLGNKPCNDFDSAKHFRFVATKGGVWDYVPMTMPLLTDSAHLGIPLFLDGMDYPLFSPGINNDEDWEPQAKGLHKLAVYEEYITHLFEQNCFPVPVTPGWPAGHACNENRECLGVNFCRTGTCTQYNQSPPPSTPFPSSSPTVSLAPTATSH